MVRDLANKDGFNVIKGSDGSQCCVFSNILLQDLKEKKFDLLTLCVPCADCMSQYFELWNLSNFEGHSVCSVLSRLQSVPVKLFFHSDSLYMEEEQNQLNGSALYMNPCEIRPESTNRRTSWILYLIVTPSQEMQSHNFFSAPCASGESQKTREKPINPKL